MNFPSKRKFVKEFDGLMFIADLLNDETATLSYRLYKKVLILMNDLVVNDEMILQDDPTFVRNYFANGDNKVMQ
jgi:hypothetical protein